VGENADDDEGVDIVKVFTLNDDYYCLTYIGFLKKNRI